MTKGRLAWLWVFSLSCRPGFNKVSKACSEVQPAPWFSLRTCGSDGALRWQSFMHVYDLNITRQYFALIDWSSKQP